MKILLISSNLASTPYFVYPLGLSMVAAALRKAGHDVVQFDFLQRDKSLDALSEVVENNTPDIVGISIRNIDNVNTLNEQCYVDDAYGIVERIRQISNSVIVLGGSGFSIMPEAILNKVKADYGIVGEGEALMVNFANDAAQGVYPKERCVHATAKLAGETIPSPYYDPDILGFYLKKGNMASVQTKRGCEYKCAYCTYPFLEGSAMRHRRPEAVVDDIQLLVDKYKTKYIFFTDSVFNDREGHYHEVLREIKKRDIDVSWTAFFRPELFNEEDILLMKESGLKAAEIGADAPSDATLRGLRKPFLFKDIAACNDLLVKHGIATAHYYMFGCPGETAETVMEGVKNIKSLRKTVSFVYMGIRILPGTFLAEIARDEGVISPGQELLEPKYYIAPGINREWLENTLTESFKGIRNCIFPPDVLDSSIQFLHSMGFSGSLWDMLATGEAKRKRQRRYAGK